MDSDPWSAAIERWRNGDPEGFAEIYARCFSLVHEIVRLRLGPRLRASSDSLDVVQEVFLGLYRLPPPEGIRGRHELLLYLTATVQNRLVDLQRYEHREKRDRRRELPAGDRSAVLRRAASVEPTPSQISLGAEAYRRYVAAMGDLADREREAVILARHVGLGASEAARRMELDTAGAFRALLSRSLAKLALAVGVP